jgi:hypothetical protein
LEPHAGRQVPKDGKRRTIHSRERGRKEKGKRRATAKYAKYAKTENRKREIGSEAARNRSDEAWEPTVPYRRLP